MTPPAGLKALIAHRNVLVALTRYLMQDRTGGVMGAAVQMLVQVLHARGALAYRLEGHELVLVTELGLPRRAKAWLAHLPVDGEPWFVAQRVVQQRKAEVDTDLAAARAGLSIRPALESGDWRALCGIPLIVGRDVFGAIVIAADSETRFDKQTVVLLETVGGILALALERETMIHNAREQRFHEQESAGLATLGILSSSLVRDMVAPLGALHLQLEEQAARLGDPGALEEAIQLNHVMADNVRHLAAMLDRVSGLTEESEPSAVDLAEVVEAVATLLLGNLAARGIRLEIAGIGAPMFVHGRSQALQMLLVQLILYSAQECEATARSNPLIALQLESVGGVHALKVETSGHIGQRSGSKIFDTMLRGAKGHAAVGLELAKQTVAQHDGTLEVTHPSPSGGHIIRVVLPAGMEERAPTPIPSEPDRAGAPYADAPYADAPYADAPAYDEPYADAPYAEAPYADAPAYDAPYADAPAYDAPYADEPFAEAPYADEPYAPPAPRRSDRPSVLWIDDDTAMAERLSETIQSHEVFIAPSLSNARDLLPSLDPPPELVLCSVVMPDGDGTALHREVDEALGSRFVFVTSGLLQAEAAAYLKSAGCRTLIKPITEAEVLGLLGPGAPRSQPRHKMGKKLQTTLPGHGPRSAPDLELDFEPTDPAPEEAEDGGRMTITGDIQANEISSNDLVGSLLSDMDESDIDW